MFEPGCDGWLVQHGVAALLGLGRRGVADRLQQPATVEPVDAGQRGELDGLEAPPGSAPVNEFRLVEAVDRLVDPPSSQPPISGCGDDRLNPSCEPLSE